jgi:hypothetical protein
MRKIVLFLILTFFVFAMSFGYSQWKPASNNNCEKQFLSFYNELKGMYDQAVKDKAGSPDFLSDLESLLAKYNPDNEQSALLNDTFNALSGWTIDGREQGVNSYEFVSINNKPWLHLHHEEFTEISIYKLLKVPENAMGKKIYIEATLMGKVSSTAGSKSDFYASAGLDCVVLKEKPNILPPKEKSNTIQQFSKSWSTSTYPFTYVKNNYTNITAVPIQASQMVPTKVQLEIDEKITKNAKYIYISFGAYGSGWPYDLKADLWINSIKITVGN